MFKDRVVGLLKRLTIFVRVQSAKDVDIHLAARTTSSVQTGVEHYVKVNHVCAKRQRNNIGFRAKGVDLRWLVVKLLAGDMLWPGATTGHEGNVTRGNARRFELPRISFW